MFVNDNFSTGQDIDTGFGSEIGFLLIANSPRTLLCVRNMGRGAKPQTYVACFTNRSDYISH